MSGHEAVELDSSVSPPPSEPAVRTTVIMNERARPRVIYLVLGFLGAFCVSWLAVVALFLSLKPSSSERFSASSVATEPESPFVDAVAINRSGPALSVAHHPLLNPSEGDFMMLVWFKLQAEVDAGERSAFIGKYDPQSENPEGYAVALIGGADGVRPHVYWQNDKGRGRWFAFASTNIQPNEWYLMGLTFRAQRYLGLHIARAAPNANPEVLGGYDLGGAIIPASSANLMIGAFRHSKFRGHIGPFAILRDIDIAKDAPRIMKQLARDPSIGSSIVESSQVALWADPIVDKGSLGLTISELQRDQTPVKNLSSQAPKRP